MAILNNREKNIVLEMNLIKNSYLDYDFSRHDSENWVPFILQIKTPTQNLSIDEQVNATLTLYELNSLDESIDNLVLNIARCEEKKVHFFSSESFFEFAFTTIPEDNVIEMEVWINMGTQSNGKFFGYDEGVRFIINSSDLNEFRLALKQQTEEILQLKN